MNSHRALLLSSVILCAAAATGCRGTTSSDIVATKDILATITVSDDGDGSVYVNADLEVRTSSDNNYLHLVQGDSLIASFGKQQSTLIETGSGHYEATFALSNAADFWLGFSRAKQMSAPATGGVLPDAVDLGGIDGSWISRDYDTIIVQLPPTSGAKRVTIEGYCISTFVLDLDESASDIYLGPGSLTSSYPGDECDVTMTVTTTIGGVVDPALHPGSSILLERSRSTVFYSVP